MPKFPTLKNGVNPLTWNVPIANSDGTPTNEFQRKWGQQASTSGSIPDLTTKAAVSARLDLISALPGSLLVRGSATWGGLASPSDATKFLNGAATPGFAKVKDTDLAVTDVTGNNVSTGAHGFAPKLPNDATKFLDGTGAYSTPASGGGGAASIQDDGTNVYVALSDTDGQLVLDGSGDPVFAPEVFPLAAIPALPAAALGGYASGTTAAVVVNKVKGVTDASNAAAGDVGEYDSVSVVGASGTSLATSGAPSDIVSKLLQPGDYDVWGMCAISYTVRPTSVNYASGWISTTSATFPSPFPETSFAQADYHGLTMTGDQIFSLGIKRISISVATTVYMSARAAYSGGNVVGYGILAWRRRR